MSYKFTHSSNRIHREMVYSAYTKRKILCYYREGYRPPSISVLLLNEGLKASKVGVAKFIARFEATGAVALHRKTGSGRSSKNQLIFYPVKETQTPNRSACSISSLTIFVRKSLIIVIRCAFF